MTTAHKCPTCFRWTVDDMCSCCRESFTAGVAYDASKAASAEPITDREDDGYWESRCSDAEEAARNAITERDALKAECEALRNATISPAEVMGLRSMLSAANAECAKLANEARKCLTTVYVECESAALVNERDALKAECADLRGALDVATRSADDQMFQKRAARAECANLRESHAREIKRYCDAVDKTKADYLDALINAKSEARQQQERATRAEARLEAMTGDAAVEAACAGYNEAYRKFDGSVWLDISLCIQAAIYAARAEVCK